MRKLQNCGDTNQGKDERQDRKWEGEKGVGNEEQMKCEDKAD